MARFFARQRRILIMLKVRAGFGARLTSPVVAHFSKSSKYPGRANSP